MTSDNAFTILMLEKLCGDLRSRVEQQQAPVTRTQPSTASQFHTRNSRQISAVISILCGLCLTGMTM